MMPRPLPSPLFPLAAAILVVAALGPVAVLLLTVPPHEAMAALAVDGRSALRVSLIASLGATLAATLLGVPAGYALARAPSRVRAPAIFALALPLAFPPVASGLMLLYVFGIHAPLGGWLAGHGISVVDSLLGVAVAEFFVSGSFVAIAATAAFA
ncbi:MAG: hypothetical protein WCD38_12015, partial [Candidatus Tumulicola sp.]